VSASRAPIAANGLRIRSIGLRESDSSHQRKAALLRRKQAGDHAHRRAGVATIQRRAEGVTRPPRRHFHQAVFEPAHLRASASMQPNVEAQSAPVEKLAKREVPSAKAANIP